MKLWCWNLTKITKITLSKKVCYCCCFWIWEACLKGGHSLWNQGKQNRLAVPCSRQHKAECISDPLSIQYLIHDSAGWSRRSPRTPSRSRCYRPCSGFYYPLFQPNHITECISRIFTMPTVEETLIQLQEMGFSQVGTFSWFDKFIQRRLTTLRSNSPGLLGFYASDQWPYYVAHVYQKMNNQFMQF